MRWSWKVGQVAGIDLRIHATFLLLMGWVWVRGGMVDGALFTAALFACVVLHELGHAMAARRFGIQTRDITLLPIGGLARLERVPEEPRQELWVALAGPAVNGVLAMVLWCWLSVMHQWEPLSQLRVAAGPFAERLLLANVMLALFNMIPAFPMDGGRVLRALLAVKMGHPKATQVAVTVGQGLAFVLGFAGLFSNPMLLFIGLFVWIGASQEGYASLMKSALAGTPARAAMLTDFEELEARDTLAEAVRLTLRGTQQDFPVMEEERVVGVLTRGDLLAALSEHGQDYPVALAMRRDFLIASSTEMLEVVFQRLEEGDCHTMPVFQDGRLAGLVTMDHLGEYLLIQAALRDKKEKKHDVRNDCKEVVHAGSTWAGFHRSDGWRNE